MSAGGSRPPLLVVLGPTGAGKSALAHAIARLRNGEIVSADAFAVYRGFDIGTAKPTAEERREVPYHLIDVVSPAETFSAGRWAEEARRAVEDIARRGKLPIVCGGSGFYIEALLRGLAPGAANDPSLRRALARWGERDPDAARRFLLLNDPRSSDRIAPGNLRYVLRAIEILLSTGIPASARERSSAGWVERWHVLKVAVEPSREDLYARIAARVRGMLNEGWDVEVRRLIESGVLPEANAFRAIGYREVALWVSGRSNREETERNIVAATRALAKRQKTWFSRERDIFRVEPAGALAAVLGMLKEGETREKADKR